MNCLELQQLSLTRIMVITGSAIVHKIFLQFLITLYHSPACYSIQFSLIISNKYQIFSVLSDTMWDADHVSGQLFHPWKDFAEIFWYKKLCYIWLGCDDRGTQVSISGQYNFLSFQIKPVDKKWLLVAYDMTWYHENLRHGAS